MNNLLYTWRFASRAASQKQFPSVSFPCEFNKYFQPMNPSKTPEQPLPDFAWYQRQNKSPKQPTRCPFATAKICPRYFRSLALFGKYSVSERMSPEEIERLE